jgi:hypothetical protein
MFFKACFAKGGFVMKREIGYFICLLIVLLALSLGACASASNGAEDVTDTGVTEEDRKISIPDDDLGTPIPAEDLK